MEVKVESEWTVGNLIEWKRENLLQVNQEYQRGLRWTDMQKRMFIDSIFRGYSIPAFYFHKHEISAGPLGGRHYDIVDGQQRINAIYDYSEGGFDLLAPSDDSRFRFPNFVKGDPCPWGGKYFSELSEELQGKLKDHKIVAYEITTENDNEIRDLFIRLQGGTPLTPQDKRDSWPGNFTEFVLRVGGKKDVPKWPGLPLFKELTKVSNESRRRQLVAQIFMLFWTVKKENKFCDIKSANIDEFYHSQVGFDENADEARRFKKICDKLYAAFSGKPKVVGHHLIHLFLLVDSFLDEFVQGTWESNIAGRLHDFERRCREAVDANKKNIETEYRRYYTEYAQWTQTRSDNTDTIRRRHAFFTMEMRNLLSPKPKDPQRVLEEFDKKIVFFRDREQCQYCLCHGGENHKVAWEESDMHHVTPHTDGGMTSIDNAALVHRDCHPKGKEEVEEFRNWWHSKGPASRDPGIPNEDRGRSRRSRAGNRSFPPPGGTKARFKYRDQLHFGEIQDGKLVVKGIHCNSFSEASREITNTSRNGWEDWELLLPDEAEWALADEWRSRD